MRPIAAFVGVHFLLAWLFWTAGFDFQERGQPLFWFAYLGLGLGGLAAFLAHKGK